MARFGTFFHGRTARQERACLTSFIRHGHDVTVFSYEPLELPPGVHIRDAAEILPRDRLHVAERGPHRGSLGQFANHFRYCMNRETHLAWIDTDIICLSGTWPETPILLARQDASLINGAVLRLPSDHPLLDDAIAACERLTGLAIWGLTGAHLLTALVNEHDLWGSLLPIDSFYPIHFGQAADLLRPLDADERLHLPDDALCVHLWSEMLRRKGHDRHDGPAPGSALAGLLDFAEGKRPTW